MTDAIPWAGTYHYGLEGYKRLYDQLFNEFDVNSFEIYLLAETKEKVYVEGHFRFQHKTTGKLADSDWCVRFNFKDTKITGGQFYENTYAVAVARI